MCLYLKFQTEAVNTGDSVCPARCCFKSRGSQPSGAELEEVEKQGQLQEALAVGEAVQMRQAPPSKEAHLLFS